MEISEAMPFLEEEHHTVVTTLGRSGRPQTTIVRGGPYHGGMVFVVRGSTVKLANLHRDARCTVLTVAPDWTKFVTVEGSATIRGPDNTDPEELRLLLREAFAAAGGTHDNWDEYDRVMREDRRAVVLVSAERVYGRV